MIRFTPEARLLAAPFRTYHALAREAALSPGSGWIGALGRVVLCAAIAGTGTAAAATGRISWSLALSGTLCWLPLIALQLLTAAAVIAPLARAPRTPAPPHPGAVAPSHPSTLFALFFTAHAPWSLWVLLASAVLLGAPGFASQIAILATAIVPLAWTGALGYAYFREVFCMTRGSAIAAAAAHQALTVTVIVAYVAWAVQLWPRLVALRLG